MVAPATKHGADTRNASVSSWYLSSNW